MSPTLMWFEMPASTRRMSLPERVFGMSGTICTVFGRAIFPIIVSIVWITFATTSWCGVVQPGRSDTYISGIRPVGILFEALRKILFAESFHHFRVFQVGLIYELLRGLVNFLFLPVNCNVRVARCSTLFRLLRSCHCNNLFGSVVRAPFYICMESAAMSRLLTGSFLIAFLNSLDKLPAKTVHVLA